MNIKNRKIKGFTLIELMVIIAIVGILSTIVLPLFSKTNDLHESMITKEQSCKGKHVYANGTYD